MSSVVTARRNRLVHAYFSVNLNILWQQTAQNDWPYPEKMSHGEVRSEHTSCDQLCHISAEDCSRSGTEPSRFR